MSDIKIQFPSDKNRFSLLWINPVWVFKGTFHPPKWKLSSYQAHLHITGNSSDVSLDTNTPLVLNHTDGLIHTGLGRTYWFFFFFHSKHEVSNVESSPPDFCSPRLFFLAVKLKTKRHFKLIILLITFWFEWIYLSFFKSLPCYFYTNMFSFCQLDLSLLGLFP